MTFFDKDPNIKKVTADIYTFYKYNSILMIPMIVWYIMCSDPHISSFLKPYLWGYILGDVVMFVLDAIHIFLMILIIRRERHNAYLRKIEPKIQITNRAGRKRLNIVRLRYWAYIPVVLYTIGAIILIITLVLQIDPVLNTYKLGTVYLANLISIMGIVISITRMIVNRKSQRHAKALVDYVNQHPEECQHS